MAMGMKDLLVGQDPFDTGAIWEKLYTYTCMSGRRGAVICAIGAIDMALWDIKGKALGLPCYKLLGGAHSDHIVPYASLQPWGDTVDEYGDSIVEWAKKVEELGAGEILLTSKDADGTKEGYDLEMTKAVAEAVSIPVTASGGAGTLEHLYEGVTIGKAAAVLAASVFHFGEISIPQAKQYLKEKGIPVAS